MMKKIYGRFWLLPSLLCVLSLTFSACSDNDDEKNSVDEQEQSSMPAGVSDDATLLGSLLSSWSEEFSDDVNSSILSKQYEATVGEADEVQQTVRSMVVGTQDDADAYARQVLGVLGASRANINGFSWSNSAIGTVSYHHGTGNELGVISVDIKQLPGLTKLRLLKDFEGNAPATAYYQKGDIVKYTGSGKNKDRYFLCLNNHESGAQATWISFDCGEQVNSLAGGTCGWSGVGNDIYYDIENAGFEPLEWWLTDFVLNRAGYASVKSHLAAQPLTVINQIIPSSEELRQAFVEGLVKSQDDVILDVNKPVNNENFLRADRQLDTQFTDVQKSTTKTVRTYYPTGMLLYGPLRWSMHMLSWDYWVPNLVLVEANDVEGFEALLQHTPSQYNDKSHFEWSQDGMEMYNGSYYYIFRVGMHWTHEYYKKDNVKYYNLLDFTKNVRKLNNQVVNLNVEANLDWTLHNVTSHVLKVKDTGEKYKYFETVYRAKEGAPVVPQPVDDGRVKPGYLVGSDGQFYANKAACDKADVKPVAMICYVGEPGSVETGTPYNALAMSVDDYRDKRYLYSYSKPILCTGYAIKNDGASISELSKKLDGLQMTERLAEHLCDDSHDHDAAALVWKFGYEFDDDENFSRWFIPSAGQVILCFKGQGFNNELGSCDFTGSKWLWRSSGLQCNLPGLTMTTTENEDLNIWVFTESYLTTSAKAVVNYNVRPVMALTVPQ